ncbi:YeeE/YedE [Pokkaliibacter plantistimulans]|uniref:YeeE/YedE n=1 Tax=Proteobacteria bacterium 228 TaxID=2083153 RepID=A0A2S5KMF7_9PROT|nr:YeeE/YedE family protein [Pokkaliibacter plantistimulans]PPC75719.1 YeeE/YedE [Pokkaliibacter plantistimulans]
MSIDWTHFTPWASLSGGLLIGLAAAIFVLLNGKIAGISGIVAGLLHPTGTDWLERFCFFIGLLLAPMLYMLIAGSPEIDWQATPIMTAIAGLIVGFGTRLGSGCTSGHGVCGLSRLSPRSLVATLTFMAAGFATVFVIRHLLN